MNYLTTSDEHKHNKEGGTNAERVKIEDKEMFAPVEIAVVMVTRSRNRPYVRISCESRGAGELISGK